MATKNIRDPQQGDIFYVLGQLRAPGAKKAGWIQGWDEGSRGCRFLKQYLCHRLPEWMSFWSSSGVQVETRGCSTCTRPWSRDQGLLLAVSISNKIRRKATDKGMVARNYWMNDPNTLADSQNFISFSGLGSMQWNEWNCFASLWGMISVARPLAKPQQLPHGCLLCGLSPDAEKPAVSVYRKCICSEPQSQNSNSRRQEDFQQCAACPSAMWPNFGSWLTGQLGIPEWTLSRWYP